MSKTLLRKRLHKEWRKIKRAWLSIGRPKGPAFVHTNTTRKYAKKREERRALVDKYLREKWA